MNTLKNLWLKFRNEQYRKGFVSAEVKRMIPFQIGSLRKLRGMSQEELAKKSGLTQGVISRAEDPDYGNLTVNTIIKIANGFDLAFVGRFVPYSELASLHTNLSEESLGSVPSYETEEQQAKAVRQVLTSRSPRINQEAAAVEWLVAANTQANIVNRPPAFQGPIVDEGFGPLRIPLQLKVKLREEDQDDYRRVDLPQWLTTIKQ